MNYQENLKKLGLKLPEAKAPVGNYVATKISGKMLFVSGQISIDEKGELVAIAVAGLAKDLTEGINFGIKSSAAESFLKSNKIKPNKSFFAFSKDSEKLLNILEESTVYTFCELN